MIAAGAGALAAAAAETIIAPARVLAANGGPVLIGQLNQGTAATKVSGGSAEGLHGVSTGADGVVGESSAQYKSGVYGTSSHTGGYGVAGRNLATGAVATLGGPRNAVRGDLNLNDVAVYGENAHAAGTGVGGRNMATGSRGYLGAVDGVQGQATQGTSAGVRGSSTITSGCGVIGSNDALGTEGQLGSQAGVVAQGTSSAPGLMVMGRAVFGNAGFQVVVAGKSSVKFNLNPSDLTANSIVFANLLQYRSGIYVTAAVPNVAAGTVTIYLNKKVTAATKVAYMVADW